MSHVTSRDGTRIAFSRTGDGPPVVLVDGALSHRTLGPIAGVAAAVLEAAGGSASVFGLSSGAVLALEAAASDLPIERLVLYEPPLSVEPEGGDDAERLGELLAAGRKGDAVEWFLASAGVPPDAIAEMRRQPEWPAFEAVAPTLAYDYAVVGDGGIPRERAARVSAPTVVGHGAESPDFFRDAAAALAAAIPGARCVALAGQSWGRPDPAALAGLVGGDRRTSAG